MIASRYNFLFDLPNGNPGLYNSRSRALTELDGDSVRLVPAILADPESETSAGNPQVVEQLLFGGFLLSDEGDEITDLKIRNGRHRFGTSALSLAIAPTFACNLDCPECRGKSHKLAMSRLVEKSLLEFAADRISKADSIKVTWFGGEPLLRPETIERVNGAIAEDAAKHGAAMAGGHVITNGALLDADMARSLQAAGISSAEITLAGVESRHDQIRRLPGGQGSFAAILDNLAEAGEVLKLVLRLPGEPDQADQARELVDLLDRRGLLGQAHVYFAGNRPHRQACSSLNGRCDQDEAALAAQLDLYSRLLEHPAFHFNFPFFLPQERCGFDSENAFIIAPSGYIFRCWEEIAPAVDQSVGSLFKEESELFQIVNQRKFSRWDPFDRSDCSACGLLPLCMGGCAHYAPDSHRGKCRFWRDHHLDLQTLRGKYILREEVIK